MTSISNENENRLTKRQKNPSNSVLTARREISKGVIEIPLHQACLHTVQVEISMEACARLFDLGSHPDGEIVSAIEGKGWDEKYQLTWLSMGTMHPLNQGLGKG